MFIKTVLLLKDKEAIYEREFTGRGFRAESVTVLESSFCNRDLLADYLKRKWSGIIVTSTRAAKALQALKAMINKETLFYCIGPRTAESVRNMGFCNIVGSDCGTSLHLANRLVSLKDEFAHPLLFLTGDKRMENIPSALSASHISYEEVCVYTTSYKSGNGFQGELQNYIAASEWLIFFSPSGVDAVCATVGIECLKHHKIATIGPTTAKHLSNLGLEVSLAASKPEPSTLAAEIAAFEAKSLLPSQ